jgi:hypothetical protein
MRAPKDLDKECLSLFFALNRIPGVRTTESCCGHGRSPYHMWMMADSPDALYAIGRALDRRYYGNGTNWTLQVTTTDLKERRTQFLLESKVLGRKAYRAADKLAEDILDFLRLDKKYRWGWYSK